MTDESVTKSGSGRVLFTPGLQADDSTERGGLLTSEQRAVMFCIPSFASE